MNCDNQLKIRKLVIEYEQMGDMEGGMMNVWLKRDYSLEFNQPDEARRPAIPFPPLISLPTRHFLLKYIRIHRLHWCRSDSEP
jgi:hypothetical protein